MINKDESINKLNEYVAAEGFNNILNIIKALIKNGVSIRELEARCPQLNTYMIINYLLVADENDIDIINAIKDYYSSIIINQNKCLIVSDNHMGRLKDKERYNNYQLYNNERGLYSAYNHLIKNGISYVIHLGDLLEGNSDKKHQKLEVNEQLAYLKRAYPRIGGVDTLLLYGNHDYNLTYFDNVNCKFYKVCPNTELIGLNYSYINMGDVVIKVSHYCKKADYMKNLDLPHDIELSGHSHIYNVHEDTHIVTAPALSCTSKYQDSAGYLEMINEENEYVFKFFDQYGNEVSDMERVLKKKL